MITGVVTAYREAIIRLNVRGSNGEEKEIEAVIDTGFDGYLTLPSVVAEALGLTWRSRGRALLADGSESVFDIYEGSVVWDGEERRILIDVSDTEPLVGMGMLNGYELCIQAIMGGRVEIEAIPR